MKWHTRKKASGFTIAEMIIAIAIISILLAFIVVVSGQMLVVTAKIHAKDVAVSLAQKAIEELRSTLNIPLTPTTVDIPGFPGYSRTITATSVVETSTIPYLWAVSVQVQGPRANAILNTYIQTYRPQVNFYFPSSDLAFLSNHDTNLVGTVFTQTGTVAQSNVQIRTRSNGAPSWNGIAWSPLSSLNGNLFMDVDCNPSKPAPDPLQPGTTYFFNVVISGSGDGTTLDIQAQVIDSKGYYNFQPAQAQAGSSWIQLVTDNTPPTLSLNVTAPYLFSTAPTTFTPTFGVQLSASDGTGTAGVFRVYLQIWRKIGTSTEYWNEYATGQPAWTMDGLYYSIGDLSADGNWYYPGTFTPSLIKLFNDSVNASPPGTYYYLRAWALDKVIGRYYSYKTTISQLETAINPLPWADVNANTSSTETMTIVRVQTPSITAGPTATVSPPNATLSGTINPNGLPTTAWFEWKREGELTSSLTPSATVGSGLPLVFTDADFSQTINGLTSTGTYFIRLWAQNYSAGIIFSPTTEAWIPFHVP